MSLMILIIPVITCIILFTKYYKETVWWEYAVVIVPSLILYFFLKYAMVSFSTMDTEYIGAYVTSTTYYEAWDEMVQVQKTRQVPCGTDSKGNVKYRTETYTVWERRYHPEHWTYTDNLSRFEHSISKKMFNIINNRLQAKPEFKDMHRHYHMIDGDAYVRKYKGDMATCYPLTYTHSYENRVKASDHSIFKFRDLSPEEIKRYGVYDYPGIREMDQNPIIGKKVPYEAEKLIRYINGHYGKESQIRVFILLFDSPDINIGDMQRSHWLGGNKNEFVVCLGLDSTKVSWCFPFSWQDQPKLEVMTKQYFIDNPELDIEKYGEFLIKNIKQWKRKEFKDFEYVSVELNINQLLVIIIIIICYNIGISYWVITNDYKEDYCNKRGYY